MVGELFEDLVCRLEAGFECAALIMVEDLPKKLCLFCWESTVGCWGHDDEM